MEKIKKPITMIFTDIHLKESNCQEIEELLIGQGIEICKQNDIKECFCLGDVFDSRVSQKQLVLSTWDRILDAFDQNNITIHCIRGNHDSSDYKSSDSFLRPFKHHPNFDLIDDIGLVCIRDIAFLCEAFYDEDLWLERFDELRRTTIEKILTKRVVFLSHIAITGSSNKGHITENKLSVKMFDQYNLTLMGHYHDMQKIGDKFIHLGSLTQTNYGEDEQKGFWLLYDDLTYELVPSKTKKFKKLVVDLDNMTFKQADKAIRTFQGNNPNDFLRVEFQSKKEVLASVDKKVYQDLGLDVKMKVTELEATDIDTMDEIKALTNNDIVEKFKSWCEENEYNYKEGLTILKEVL